MITAIVVAVLVVNLLGYELTFGKYLRDMERAEIERRLRNVTR